MSGVLLNGITIIVGTVIGVSVGRFIQDRFHEIAFWAIGLCTLAFGISMIVSGLNDMGATEMGNYSLLVIVGSMVLGAFIGEALNIEKWLERMGTRLQSSVAKIPFLRKKEGQGASTFVDGFMAASLLYCVGPMTVLGSIQDGLGSHATLYLKAALDGCAAIMLATTMGVGVGFSVIPVVLFQGTLAVGSSFFANVFTPAVISSITAVGGILIIAISFDILKIKKMRVGNMLPALIIAGILGGLLG
jgi:uncharacterized membrane protein YqgA involved in biofilm formation